MSRHFIHLDGRRVHYRRWGEGPVVLAIHGSPQSSRAVEVVSRVLVASGHCVIAPDTPGNGLSTPLPGQPTSADYAKALAQFADALGLGRVALIGYHTGAATICAFGALYPERVTALAFNGLSCWSADERTRLLATYLPPFVPKWDGTHMTWAWARLEEQTVFFPWNEPTPAMRMMSYDVPGLPALQSNALDFLEAGDNYRAPYASAFGFKTEDWFPRLTVPYFLATTKTDPLRAHLARPPLCYAPFEIFEDSAQLFAAAGAHLSAYPADPAPPAPASGPDLHGLSCGFVDGVAWNGRLDGAGRPLVLLHGGGGSSRVFGSMLPGIAADRPVIALDLPGHGATADGWTTRLDSVEAVAHAVGSTVRASGIDRPAVAGQQFGGMVGAALMAGGTACAAANVGKLLPSTDEPIDLVAPSLAPEWDGAHLLRAFRIARYERLFEPWYRRNHAHAIPQGELDPADIQARALDLIHAGDYWREAITLERRHFSASGPSAKPLPDIAMSRDALAAFAA